MLNLEEATDIVKRIMPNGKIQWVIPYRNVYLFQVFSDRPFEEEMDPFYSVDKETGDFKDFSIITDGDIDEIFALVEKLSG